MSVLKTGLRAGAVALSLTALSLAGCASHLESTGGGSPLARQVTASEHCGLTAPGLLYLTGVDQVQALAGLPEQTVSLASAAELDFSREHLAIVALGQQNTGGHGVTLVGSEQVGDELRLEVAVSRPQPGGMVTQVMTTPCTVLAVTANGWRELMVHGENMNPMRRSR